MSKFFAVVIILLASIFAFSQEGEIDKKTEKIISVCKVKLTDYGKTSHFQFSYRYVVNSNENGEVTEVRKRHKEYPKFVNEEEFIPCIKTWKLNPSEKVYVHIFFGTTNEQFFISINSKDSLIKILL